MKPQVDITTRLTLYGYSEVTITVTIEGKTLRGQVTGWFFLNWRIKRMVKNFKETLKDCVAHELTE